MKDLETRLRRELPALADHFTGSAAEPLAEPRTARPPRRPFLLATATILALVVVGIWLSQRTSGDDLDVGPAVVLDDIDADPAVVLDDIAPEGPGTWSVLPEAPIDPRFYAATAWTGDEMIVWAGASADRLSAFVDGAAYNPATDSWRTLPVPGWGHPGMVSAYFEDQLVAVAKGGGDLVDLAVGTSTELPDPPRWLGLVDVAVVGGNLYGFGSTDIGESLGTIRYTPDDDAWVPGPTMSDSFKARSADTPGLGAVADGNRALLWSAENEAALLDTAVDELRLLPRLGGDGSDIATAGPVVTNSGFVVVATVDGVDVLATLDGDAWSTRPVVLPNIDLSTATVFGAGDWVMVLPADGFPVSVHVPSATALVHDQGPLAATAAPSGVWTGEELILWGGGSEGLPGVADPPIGARWTPPGPGANGFG
jgi:hypothetical protein